MKKTTLRSYAQLIARKGVNIQKGQEVIIRAELDQPEFVEILVQECYKAGASFVEVEWSHQSLTKYHARYRSQKILNRMRDWEIAKMKNNAEVLPCMIYLTSEDPDGLKGVNNTKLMKARQAKYPIIKPIRESMDNKYQWCIAGVPGKAWAKKVFPGMMASTAEKELWNAILSTSRVDDDPMAAWDAHNADLKKKYTFLNDLRVEKLHFKSANGTDFTVGMNLECEFHGGGDTTLGGVYFNPNIPSEEIFTSPMKGQAEGIVYSSKPLSYNGELIENFSVRFEGGKAVEVKAEKGQKLLEEMIAMDEGAAYLGEVALVSYDSPVNNTGILFYNTLYDENACCHLAFGAGFNECLKGFENLTYEQCKEKGVNDSMIHVDFMIGTRDMTIDAVTAEGKTVRIFENGTWAI
ncbi:MAG: aminopeptidase [Ruminococcaceae bacterium]|nr:aminopeptidase [Oscillospiraceae bacterium]